MKKLLVFVVMFSMLFGVVGVIGVEQDQHIVVKIGEEVTVSITPEILDFGTVKPGETGIITEGDITFDGTGSTVDVTVTVMSVTGFPFEDGLMFDDKLAMDGEVGQSWDLLCTSDEETCNGTLMDSTVPTLDVPSNAAQGIQEGIITYNIMATPGDL